MTEEVTNPDLRSQDERQLELIRELNSRVPSNPQGDAADAGLKKILQSLSKNSLSDALRDSFSADKLKEWKDYAEKEFEAMGQINRKRVRNLVGLSDEDMHHTMFEGFFLFDINPLDAPTVEVQARTGEFDDDGKPVMKTFSYEVFQKNALYGIEGVERFVPKSICEGEEGNARLPQRGILRTVTAFPEGRIQTHQGLDDDRQSWRNRPQTGFRHGCPGNHQHQS